MSASQNAGYALKGLSAIGLCALLGACGSLQSTQPEDRDTVSLVSVSDKSTVADVELLKEQREKNETRTVFEHKGSGNFVRPAGGISIDGATPGNLVSVSFDNAPLDAVLAAVLGDLLKVPYSLEGGVTGSISLVSTDPVPRDAVLDMLEFALESQGIAMVQGDNGIYRIGQSGQLRREIPLAVRQEATTRGYGVRIVPLRFLSVLEAQTVLEPLGLKDNILHVDPVRNILMLGASAPQMRNALRTLEMLDVDVLQGMSFGVYEVANLDAATVVERIERMIGNSESGVLAGATRLLSLDEINSVMIVAPSSAQLASVSQWQRRFDQFGLAGQDEEQAGTQLSVYEVENGDAETIAALLGQIFTGEAATGKPAATSGSLAPGLGKSELSSATAEGGAARAPSAARNNMATGTLTENGTRIVADEANNSLLVMATAKEWRSIRSALSKIDKLPAQVLVEVSIWEVTLNDELNYGVEWFFNSKGGAEGLGDRGGLLTMGGGTDIGRSVPGFSYVFSGSDWRAVINTLASRSNVKSLSSPSILVQDNREASIQVGNQQPIQTSQTVNTSNTGVLTQSVELKDTGIQLKVKPRVNSGGLVIMEIMQEVTDVGATDAATGQRSFLKRNIESTVAIQSGDTIILGGLIQENNSDGDSGVPFLHRVPVLGTLFGTKNKASNRTELLVTISPRAINKYQDFQKIGDSFRSKMHQITDSFRAELKENISQPQNRLEEK
ncbi:MAG: type II secretion system secretin GspD [Thiopseudomonas sp.]